MDFAKIRRVAITALFSDDTLMERFALKGGNALSLIYGFTMRSSLDLDFSMDGDFDDVDDARHRIFRGLRDRFGAAGYVVFDEKMEVKPELKGPDQKPWWGGYEISFKLIDRQKHASLKDRPGKLRVNAMAIGSGEHRSFKIDLSKFEHTDGKAEHDLDHFTIYVYTPEMIAAEKLRAICQQMSAYPHTGNRRARARDFFDIHQVVTTGGIDLAAPDNIELVRLIFGAKRVPPALLGKIAGEREFHRSDWQSVISATKGDLRDFDYYFDFVIEQVKRLEPLWME